MKLPRYIAAMNVQNTSGLVVNSIGPGSTLCMRKPASMIALGAANGMPSVSSGIIEPITALLLADSGPTTPSTAPLPNSLGVLRHPFLERIGDEGRNHRARPRQQSDEEAEHRAAQHRHHRAPHFLLARIKIAQADLLICGLTYLSTAMLRISETPKSPIAIGRKSMPSISCSEPKVKRG